MLFLIPNKLILKNTNFQGWPSKNFKPENVGPGYIFFTISSSYFLWNFERKSDYDNRSDH